jgi:hypothetical protein
MSFSKRPRGNDLHRTSIVTAAPVVSEGLRRAVLGDEYGATRQRQKDRPAADFSGPKPRKAGRPVREPDEVILEIRRLYEYEGFTPPQIKKHLATAGIDVATDRAYNITRYTTRAHLVPQSGHPPYITHPSTESK